MIEQPLDYDDIRDHARLQEQIRTPICLDESLHTVRAAEEAIALGACRIINIKPGRVGGHARIHPAARPGGRSRRSGVARRHARNAASAARTTFICRRSPGFTLPGDVAASRRYFDAGPDRAGDRGPAGRHDRGADAPGIGVTVVQDRVEAASVDRLELCAPA